MPHLLIALTVSKRVSMQQFRMPWRCLELAPIMTTVPLLKISHSIKCRQEIKTTYRKQAVIAQLATVAAMAVVTVPKLNHKEHQVQIKTIWVLTGSVWRLNRVTYCMSIRLTLTINRWTIRFMAITIWCCLRITRFRNSSTLSRWFNLLWFLLTKWMHQDMAQLTTTSPCYQISTGHKWKQMKQAGTILWHKTQPLL